VIIPAHNSAAFLLDTLHSVRSQTYPDWEVVAVDDGSSDETWSVLDAAGPRVRALRNDTAAGPAAARNRALAQATGELVVFLDADDLLRARYLESQIACFETARRSGRNVGLVTCDALLLDADGYARHTYLDTIRDRRRPLTLSLVLTRNPIYIASLVPTAVGESVGWFDPELFGTEDFGLWVKILERGYEAVRNPEPLAVYRRHAGTISSNIARQGVNNRRVYELALARGALGRRERRIAKRAIRYNRAMEAVAGLRFSSKGARSPRQLMRLVPLLAWVAITNPRWWRQWVAILRTGRQPPPPRRPIRGPDER
jgi:teichuronic acid biosynthesis glycosyltransferase TuaG